MVQSSSVYSRGGGAQQVTELVCCDKNSSVTWAELTLSTMLSRWMIVTTETAPLISSQHLKSSKRLGQALFLFSADLLADGQA